MHWQQQIFYIKFIEQRRVIYKVRGRINMSACWRAERNFIGQKTIFFYGK